MANTLYFLMQTLQALYKPGRSVRRKMGVGDRGGGYRGSSETPNVDSDQRALDNGSAGIEAKCG